MPNEPKTLESWLKNTWKDFSIMIRVEAADAHGNCECVTCGIKHHWHSNLIHAGHCLAARYPNSPVKYEETNVACQCRHDNMLGMVTQWRPHASRGVEDVHRRFLDYVRKKHGQAELARLEFLRSTGKMKTGQERIDELRVMRAEYKQRAAVAIEEKGL